MDVQMPDGTIVTGVPDNITQSELLGRYQSFQPPESGLASLKSTLDPTSNAALGFVSRGAGLIGSGLEAVQRAGDYATLKAVNALPFTNFTPEQAEQVSRPQFVGRAAEASKAYSEGINYTPSTTLGELGDNPLKVIPFIAERIITSTPDMAAAVFANPAYIVARTNEILNDRLKNDEKQLKDATVGDFSLALAAAVIEGKSEKFATEKLLKGKTLTGANAATRIGKSTAIQSGTEGGQELVTGIAGSIGTKRGIDPKELGEGVLESMIVGGGMGAGVRGTQEYLQSRNKPEADFTEPKTVIDPDTGIKRVYSYTPIDDPTLELGGTPEINGRKTYIYTERPLDTEQETAGIAPPATPPVAPLPPQVAPPTSNESLDREAMIAEFRGQQLPLAPPPASAPKIPTWDTLSKGQKVTLYRGEDAQNESGGMWWTTNRAKAEKYGAVSEITLDAEQVARNAARGQGGADEFVFTNARPADLVAQPENLQGKLPGEPAPPAAPVAQPAQIPLAENVQPSAEDIVPLDDKGEPIKTPESIAAPKEVLDPNIEAQLAAEPFDPDSIILPPKEIVPPPPPPAAKKPKAPKVAQVYYGKDAAGNTNVPVSEGGLPFTTKAEAEKIKALQPELRVQKVKGGWLLGEKSEQYKAADKLRAQNLTKIDVPGLIGDILRMGGLDPAFKSNLGFGEKENPSIGNRRLFAAPGKGVAPQTVTEMYMEDRPDEAEFTGQDIDFEQSLPDRIKAELKRIQSGERIETPEQALERRQEEDALEYEAKQDERDRAAQIEAKDISAEVAAEQAVEASGLEDFRQQMLDAGYTEQDLNVIGFTKASPELQAEVAALEKQVSEAGLDAPGILESLSRTYGDRLITKQEYYAKAKDELAKAIREKAVQGGGRDVSQADVPESAAREEGLVSPSEQDLKAKQEADDKAEAAKAKAERDAAAKEKADAERKDIAARSEKAAAEFKLGKSAEDDLSGQKDILAIAKKADVPPELQKPTDFVLKEGRIQQVVLAARALADGKITKAEYDAYIDAYAPISTIPNPEGPLSVDGMKRVLKSNQVDKINPDIKDGTRVGIRMDINALKRARALSEKTGDKVSGSVVSIHEGSDKNTQGNIIGYSAAASIKNARFAIRNEQKAFKVAQGIEDKSPQQTIEGEWVNISPEEAYSRVKSLLKDPAWSQVSLDPLRHSFFYDRSNKQPVVAADEILQVGRFVLAKNVKYAPRNEFLYNVGKKNKSKEFKTLDGFTFYLTADGRVVDSLDPDKVDMSWDSFDAFMESTSNLRTIFPDQEIASSNSAEQIRKENIAKYAGLKQKLAAIQRRFTEGKTKEFDKETYKYLYRQADDLKEAIQSTKEPKTSPADFLARAAKELADGNISQEVYDVVDAMYKKNPSLLDGLRLSVKTATGNAADLDLAGQFLPLTKIVRLFKESDGTTNPATLRHEITHSLEQLMNQDAQASLVDAWGKSLLKATRNAKTEAEKTFFVAVGNFIDNPSNDTILLAVDAMPDYSYYQYINPSEFWAVNAEPLMASYLSGGWQRFKTSVKGLFEALKNTLGFDNKSSVYKTFDSVIKGERDRTSPMLSDYLSMVSKMLPTYNVTKPTKKPSQATLPGIAPAPKSLPLKAKPAATWQSLEPMTWKDTRAIQLFDKHRNLDLVQKEITEIVGEINNDLDAYRAETLAHGRAEKQVKDFLIKEFRPIIKEMKDNNVTDENLTEYLVMRHAKEANDLIAKRNPNDASKQDKGSGISYKKREDYFKALDPAKQKVFESLAKKVDGVLKKTRDLLEEGGVITKEERAAWESMFDFYVPLRREESDYSLPSSSYRRVGDYAKSRTGSAKDVIDVLSNIASAREIAVHRIEKERVHRAVYGLTVMNPNPEFWMAISPDAIKNKDKLIQELVDQFDLSQQDAEAFVKNIISEPTKERFNKETGVVDRYIDTNAKYADYVLPVKIDGKDRFVFFNPKNDRAMQMVQSLRGLDVPQLNSVMQMIAPVTRFFSAINTQYNLIFGLWNFARDVQGARLNLSTTPIADKKNAVLGGTFSAIPDIYKAAREQTKNKPFSDTGDGSWDDFTTHGGKVGYKDQFARLNQSTNIVNRELADLDRGFTMRKAYGLVNWISNVNDVLENATRLSAYRVALDQFKNEAEANNPGGNITQKQLEAMKARAADIAKNITVNFNRKGTWGVTAGSLYAFFNASAQGTKRLYETLSGPKGKTIMAAGIGIGIAQAIALAMAGFDEDEPTEFMKQKNLIIPTGDGKYVMWPMPFGFNVFPNLGRIFFETASKASKGQSVTPQLINTFTMLSNAFNPLGGGGLLQTIAPTVADPIVALIENKDAFGRPISRESRSTSPVPGYKLSRDPSPSISQFLAELINTVTFGDKDKRGFLSPTADQMDYLGKQLGGGVYREASGILTYVSNEIQDKDTPDYKVPIVGKIVGDLNSPPAISQRFYSNVIKMAEHEASIKGRIERRESVTTYMRENPESSMWRRANTLENEISKLNRRRREMIEKQEPVERIKKLDDQKTRMMKQFNDQVRKYN